MDLDSYLLKPVQRMGKYAFLLQDPVKEAGLCLAQQQELGELGAAEDVVRYQLCHGNDLLVVDAIRDCDISVQSPDVLSCAQDSGLVQGKNMIRAENT
ncbi:pleckstrin homology domain-containing family G member 4B-like [Manis pentadactyla]|uniref:pleckstrin homology domain-containing family G member 4B-like n=1 Tax=Manis pentadactyla TaxID=143292 RepID=UPI00255C31DD|nr:pleckstrin homology domain-containing family G member 4B-like [Manis pentadactyla]